MWEKVGLVCQPAVLNGMKCGLFHFHTSQYIFTGRAFFQMSLVSFSVCPSSLIQHLRWVKTVNVKVTFLQDGWNQQFRFIFVKSLQNDKGAVLPLMHLIHLGYMKYISANIVNTIPTLIHLLWLMNTLCLFVLKCSFSHRSFYLKVCV